MWRINYLQCNNRSSIDSKVQILRRVEKDSSEGDKSRPHFLKKYYRQSENANISQKVRIVEQIGAVDVGKSFELDVARVVLSFGDQTVVWEQNEHDGIRVVAKGMVLQGNITKVQFNYTEFVIAFTSSLKSRLVLITQIKDDAMTITFLVEFHQLKISGMIFSVVQVVPFVMV